MKCNYVYYIKIVHTNRSIKVIKYPFSQKFMAIIFQQANSLLKTKYLDFILQEEIYKLKFILKIPLSLQF